MRKFAGPNESVLSYKCAGRMSSPDFGAHGMRIARHRPRNAGWCLANGSIRDGPGIRTSGNVTASLLLNCGSCGRLRRLRRSLLFGIPPKIELEAFLDGLLTFTRIDPQAG